MRDGVQLLPNLTHVVGRDQKLFFYYEVYDPGQAERRTPQLRTSLAFYRGRIKVFETPVVERTTIDAPDRHAALFQFEVPADSLQAGPLHLPDQHRRRGRREVRLPAHALRGQVSARGRRYLILTSVSNRRNLL